MSIIWKYLDKKAAAIAALKDYDSMKFIIDNTDADIKNTYHKMAGIGSKSCGPDLLPKYRVSDDTYHFAFMLKPERI